MCSYCMASSASEEHDQHHQQQQRQMSSSTTTTNISSAESLGNKTSMFESLVNFTYDQVKPTSTNTATTTTVASTTDTQMQEQQSNSSANNQELFQRKTKWEYAIPIVFTPVAHICVSLIRQYPQHKTKLYWGVGIATFLTIQARLILMYDAGYPGAEKPNHDGLPTFLKILLF